MKSRACCGDEPTTWGGCIVKGVEVANPGANLFRHCGDGIGVRQVGGDDVCGRACAGEILGQLFKRLPLAGHEDDRVALTCIAAGDCLAEAGSDSENGDGLGAVLRLAFSRFTHCNVFLLERVRDPAAQRSGG
jgi:hypothetical protein